MGRNVDFDVTPQNRGFMKGVQKTLVEQDDFRGIGGHGPSTHRGTHSLHRQTSIGMGRGPGREVGVNFRERMSRDFGLGPDQRP